MTDRIETEVAVVGSGAAGATVARDLARAGVKVTLIEKGSDWEWPVGHLIAYATLYDIHRSKEGVIIRRGVCTGGSTMIYSGNAYDPPPGFMENLGIDFTNDLLAVRKELRVGPYPKEFYRDWKGSARLVEAAEAMGINLKVQDKFVDPARCVPGCEDCLLGCKHGAKWTSRPFIEEAKQNGATLLTRADVEKVEIEGGKARGVWAKTLRGKTFVAADKVVLAAGGLGTPVILLNSGINNAGTHFFTDPMSILLGAAKGFSTRNEVTYTFATEQFIGDYIIGTVSAGNAVLAQMTRHPLAAMKSLLRYSGTLGMFVKLCDSAGGKVEADGKISKPLSENDFARMEKGIEIAQKIMTGAGVDPDSITVARYIGGHPGGTAGVGRVVDTSLKTEVEGLYVCDASVIPQSSGVPLVLILVSLARWFTKSLLSDIKGANV